MKIISHIDTDIMELIINDKDNKNGQIITNQEDLPNNSLSIAVFIEDEEVQVRHVIKKNDCVFKLNLEFNAKEKETLLTKERKVFYKLLAIDFKDEEIEEAWLLYYQETFIKEKLRIQSQKEISDEEKNIFDKNGIQYQKLSCPSYFMTIVSAIEYDEVQYCVSISREQIEEDRNDVNNLIKDRKKQLEWIKSCSAHNIVKDVFLFLKEKTKGEIYAMLGGGSQIQIFFGNEDGYLGILYFHLERETSEKLIMEVNFEKNNKYFEDFKHDEIKLIFSK